jgi:erythromycin esterase-like protein
VSDANPQHATLDDWVADEAIPFSLDAPAMVDAAIDQVAVALGGEVDLLGFGEPLHFGEEFLLLRNRLFQRLAEAHGYSAIAIESSFPRGRLVDDDVAGREPASFDRVRAVGFSHRFGDLAANRALVEWMRRANTEPSRRVPLRFYGFDGPMEMTGAESPRQLLDAALDVLTAIDPDIGETLRSRIAPLLGDDAAWDNPAAMMDPAQSVGLSPNAAALRVEVDELIAELDLQRPALVARSSADAFLDARLCATTARQLLTYHATLARPTGDRYFRALGLRDAMMAEILAGIVDRERGRGKVLAFAHNAHLQRGPARWQFGDEVNAWWPAGAHLAVMLGPRYAVIGSAVGVSEAHGIGVPEPATLEARLANGPHWGLLIPTHGGRGLPAGEITTLPRRSGSERNPSYSSLTPESFTDFDWLTLLGTAGHAVGAPELSAWRGG